MQDPTRSILRQFTTRLCAIAGVSINGNRILVANDHARELAVLTINEDEDDESFPSSIVINGYGKILRSPDLGGGFHGRMVMSQSRYSVIANEDTQIAWIFNIGDCADHEKLDSRDGNYRNFESENYDEDGDDGYPGRQISVGKVKFPLWGGNKPCHKKRKQNDDTEKVGCMLGLDDDFEGFLKGRDNDDSYGEGGPMAIAFRGRWIVAGFSNGTLVKALLPEKFAEKESLFGISSNHLTSCSCLPSDEWHQPKLAYTKANGDDEDEYEYEFDDEYEYDDEVDDEDDEFDEDDED